MWRLPVYDSVAASRFRSVGKVGQVKALPAKKCLKVCVGYAGFDARRRLTGDEARQLRDERVGLGNGDARGNSGQIDLVLMASQILDKPIYAHRSAPPYNAILAAHHWCPQW